MELVIQVVEGGVYIARLNQPEHSERWLRVMCQRRGLSYKANMRFHSLAHVREYFEPLQPDSVWLEHHSAYDEMIGMHSSERVCRQPLYWYCQDKTSTNSMRASA